MDYNRIDIIHSEVGYERSASKKKEKKRNSLLEAAHELFLERGQEATSVDSIVERARMAKGTFYLYLRTRTRCFRR